MARHPDLTKIIAKMQTGEDFTINRPQYLAWTGVDIPERKYYTEKKSAVARRAEEMGYKVEVIPEQLVFTKK